MEERTVELRGNPLPALGDIRTRRHPRGRSRAGRVYAPSGVRARGASGGRVLAVDLRAYEEILARRGGARGLARSRGRPSRTMSSRLSTKSTVRLGSAGEAGQVAVMDVLRVRTRTAEILFMLGLEEGRFPRRSSDSPFLSEDERRALDERRGARLDEADPSAVLGTSSTPRAPGRAGGSTSSARRRPTTVRRGKRVPSGTRREACSTPTTSLAGPGRAASPP